MMPQKSNLDFSVFVILATKFYSWTNSLGWLTGILRILFFDRHTFYRSSLCDVLIVVHDFRCAPQLQSIMCLSALWRLPSLTANIFPPIHFLQWVHSRLVFLSAFLCPKFVVRCGDAS
jgi:hypothetical protein